MLHPPPLLARALEPLISAVWLFFVVWSVVVAVLWMGGEQAVPFIANDGLRAAAMVVVKASDTLWLLLAAASLYLNLAAEHGLARARVLALTIVVVAGVIAASSTATDYPLGSVVYTTRLGMKLGPVPLGWPLLWFVVVVGGRELAALIFPRASHAWLALLTGAGGLLMDLNLEAIATKFRLFWFWYVSGTHQPASPLWRNYAVWFIATGALAWLLREPSVAAPRPSSRRPAMVFVIVNLLLLVGHLRAAFSG